MNGLTICFFLSLLTIQVDAQRPTWNNWWCFFFPTNPRCQSTTNPTTDPSGNQNPATTPTTTPSTTTPPCCPVGGIWSSWNTTSECSDTCGGFGTKTMERYCLTERTCGQCTGSKTKTVACNFTPCQFPRMSCNSGYSAKAVGKQILCTNGQPEEKETLSQASCCPPGGLMDIWSDFADCSANCGSCTTTTRTQKCRTEDYGCGPCSQQTQTETKTCVTTPCKYPQIACCSPFVAKAVGSQILCQ
ncbi:Thrombospondin, type 1 repeat-containing protein [Aphelenchoides besseyi]|nr:Thrombospondin, type 1 repeat-containing protein [Aphelenchoides besseyi]KAI6219240.1 Thrombospondin, type 1 repeat-containing protein [Aphelenchoides besseyi]